MTPYITDADGIRWTERPANLVPDGKLRDYSIPVRTESQARFQRDFSTWASALNLRAQHDAEVSAILAQGTKRARS